MYSLRRYGCWASTVRQAAVLAMRRAGRPPFLRRAEDALGQEQGDQDEEQAERKQPEFRQHAGEPGLAGIDDDGPERSAGERAAATHRDPDHRLDRIGWR